MTRQGLCPRGSHFSDPAVQSAQPTPRSDGWEPSLSHSDFSVRKRISPIFHPSSVLRWARDLCPTHRSREFMLVSTGGCRPRRVIQSRPIGCTRLFQKLQEKSYVLTSADFSVEI